jgi:glycosyltransferase involved in cell wall biosynthesis
VRRLGRLARLATRLPGIARRAAAQPFYALTRLAQVSPQPVRRAVARGLLVVAPPRGHGAAARMVALDLLGRRDQALALATAGAADPDAAASTRLAMAQASLALKAPAVAERLIRDLRGPDAERPGALLVRADAAVRTGHYQEALDIVRRARAAGVEGGTLDTIERRAASEVRVLEPGWRPHLPGSPRPLENRVQGRILHLVTNSLPHRQAGYTVRSQSIGLAQRAVGLDPHFATQAGFPRNEGILGAAPQDVVDGVPYHRLDADFDRSRGPAGTVTRTAEAAAALVESLRPAVLHPATNFHNAQAALALRDRYGLPVVYEVRGFLEETWVSRHSGDPTSRAADADRYRGAKAVETACMLEADAVVTLSETMRADIIGRGVAPERVTVVPNAVDVERFTPRPRDAGLASRLGLRDGRPVLGYVSSFTGYEGIRYLISAAAILRDRGRSVHVLLVGDGDERAQLEQQAESLGLCADGSVIFTGRVPHGRVLDHYAVIDVFVVPRTADRVSQLVTPLKPYEAMALERALVVSGVDALREIVADGQTGLVFEPEDAGSLADTVEPLLDDPARRAELGRNAREWVSAHRTWRLNGERYLEVYRRLGVA